MAQKTTSVNGTQRAQCDYSRGTRWLEAEVRVGVRQKNRFGFDGSSLAGKWSIRELCVGSLALPGTGRIEQPIHSLSQVTWRYGLRERGVCSRVSHNAVQERFHDTGHNQDPRKRGFRPNLVEQSKPIHIAQAQIQNDEIEGSIASQNEGLMTAFHACNAVAVLRQSPLE